MGTFRKTKEKRADSDKSALRPNKEIPVFRVTQPYLNVNLLVKRYKPRFFQVFWKKDIISCILKGEMPFKMHKIIFFCQKKKCVPTRNLKFSDLLPEKSVHQYESSLIAY